MFEERKKPVESHTDNVANTARIMCEVTPHILRQTFGLLFRQKVGSLAALKKILGHNRIATTEIYRNPTEKHVIEEYLEKW